MADRPITVADVQRMLRGGSLQPQTDQGEAIPPTPPLPEGAVSATIEAVEVEPLRTRETVQTVVPNKGFGGKSKKRE